MIQRQKITLKAFFIPYMREVKVKQSKIKYIHIEVREYRKCN